MAVIRQSVYLEQWRSIPKKERAKLTKLWGGEEFNLANLRNDALHAGFRKNPKSAKEIVEQTEVIIKELKAIALAWDLTDNDRP